MRYEILLVSEAGHDPITKEYRAEQSEIVTVEAESLWDARNIAPIFMKMSIRGQLLRFYHEGREIER